MNADVHTLLERWARGRLRERLLVVAAHPDDETIGCGAILGRCDDAWVLHVTDGVPTDLRYARDAGFRTHDQYRAARLRESVSALSLAGIPSSHIGSLRCAEQEATLRLSFLARTLRARIVALGPALVVTHAYEGGHPDHDATRYIVASALAGISRPPALAELTGYHADGSGHSVGRFLTDHDQKLFALSERERMRKKAMLERFTSQRSVIARFACSIVDERLRPAEDVDFSRPPHPGQLFYERFDREMTGARFRELVLAAEVEARVAARTCEWVPSTSSASDRTPTNTDRSDDPRPAR